MRDAVATLGRDPAELGVAGKLPSAPGPGGPPDIEATIAGLPPLLEAGVTDVRLQLPVPAELDAALDYLRPWVEAFRVATR
jgi:hypothetical protein